GFFFNEDGEIVRLDGEINLPVFLGQEYADLALALLVNLRRQVVRPLWKASGFVTHPFHLLVFLDRLPKRLERLRHLFRLRPGDSLQIIRYRACREQETILRYT